MWMKNCLPWLSWSQNIVPHDLTSQVSTALEFDPPPIQLIQFPVEAGGYFVVVDVGQQAPPTTFKLPLGSIVPLTFGTNADHEC